MLPKNLKTPGPASRAKRALQLAVALGALVPISAGLAGVLLGPTLLEASPATPADFSSHFRYLSGLLLGVGFGFWSTVPHIEKQIARFQLLAALVVVGGLARLATLLTEGNPGAPMLAALAMELILTPALAWGQYRLSRAPTPQA